MREKPVYGTGPSAHPTHDGALLVQHVCLGTHVAGFDPLRPDHLERKVMPKVRDKKQERIQKRKMRAARYAQGLRADGLPLKNPEMRRCGAHPTGCVCYDCLFPETEHTYAPKERRYHA